jgi:hypothetical protein
MDYQVVTLRIPVSAILPPELATFSPEETVLALLLGINAVQIVKQDYAGKDPDLQKTEMAQRIEKMYVQMLQEKDQKVKELEDAQVLLKKNFEDASLKLMTTYCDKVQDNIERDNNKISGFYEKQLENLNAEIKHHRAKNDELKEELMRAKVAQTEYAVQIEHEKNRALSDTVKKNENLLQESLAMMEELKKQKNVSSSLKGLEGETYTYNLLLDVFSDFEDFDIKNTAATPHSADMLLTFKDFSVLVDSKNYSYGVDKKEVAKLEKDLANNQHVKIAWLVSLNTPINGFSKYPVMYDIKDNVCYCYINSLCKHENPKQFVRNVWYACQFLFDKFLNAPSEEAQLDKYVKNEERIRVLVGKMMKRSKERGAMLKQLTENFDETDRDLREILTGEVVSVQEMYAEVVRTWWDKHVIADTASSLKSKKVYDTFAKDDGGRGVSFDAFKQIVRGMLPADKMVVLESKGGRPSRADWTIVGVKLAS